MEIGVGAAGSCRDGDGQRYVKGSFVGSGHAEAVGLFWTPEMTGAFGAKSE